MLGTVPQRFAAMVCSGFHRPALTSRCGAVWQSVSYGELAAQANAIAAELQAVGVVAGDAVAIVAVRQVRTIAAMLAVLELGAHYVPIDPRDPPARLQSLLAAARCAALLPPLPAPVQALPRPVAAHAAGETNWLVSAEHAAERAAYVMFTSGSTGEPKAVVVPHRAIVRLVTDQQCMRFDDSRVFLQSVPLAFDASVLEVWGALLNGARCVLFPDDMLPNAAGLRDVIAAQGATTACFTASLFHALVDRDVTCLRGLEEIVVGGEALSVPHARRALAALPQTQLVNGYGPTENGVQTTCYRLPRELPLDLARVPIGVPLRGTQVALVDAQLQPVPVGQPGELIAMGEGLALGYLGDPVGTRERFVELPTHAGPRRAYRTGDRCVQLPDGNFDFLSRLDEQVKIQGHRVEPAEVQAVLAALPTVQECRVAALADPAGARRLVAHLVLSPGGTIAAVEAALLDALPSFLVPSSFVVVERMPLNANGKLDHASLPSPWEPAPRDPPPASRPPASAASATSSSLPAAVEAAWRTALGRSLQDGDVGFFDAGGRSLDAVTLHELLERACGQDLDPTFVYEFPTRRRQVQALCKLVAGT